MAQPEIITALHKHDPAVKKQLFEQYYSKLFPVVLRYSKSEAQATELFNTAFDLCLTKLAHTKSAGSLNLDQFFETEMISETIELIKAIRSEYYVASTVHAGNKDAKQPDLFENAEIVDFFSVSTDVIVKALQLLVPSQRLVFNLHVIDGYTLEDAARMLEASEQTAKSNLEKARYNLQKNIEKCLKQNKYEQSF